MTIVSYGLPFVDKIWKAIKNSLVENSNGKQKGLLLKIYT